MTQELILKFLEKTRHIIYSGIIVRKPYVSFSPSLFSSLFPIPFLLRPSTKPPTTAAHPFPHLHVENCIFIALTNIFKQHLWPTSSTGPVANNNHGSSVKPYFLIFSLGQGPTTKFAAVHVSSATSTTIFSYCLLFSIEKQSPIIIIFSLTASLAVVL